MSLNPGPIGCQCIDSSVFSKNSIVSITLTPARIVNRFCKCRPDKFRNQSNFNLLLPRNSQRGFEWPLIRCSVGCTTTKNWSLVAPGFIFYGPRHPALTFRSMKEILLFLADRGPPLVAQQITIFRIPADQNWIALFETEALINPASDTANNGIFLGQAHFQLGHVSQV